MRMEFKVLFCSFPIVILGTVLGFYFIPEPWNWSIPILAAVVCIIMGVVAIFTRGEVKKR